MSIFHKCKLKRARVETILIFCLFCLQSVNKLKVMGEVIVWYQECEPLEPTQYFSPGHAICSLVCYFNPLHEVGSGSRGLCRWSELTDGAPTIDCLNCAVRFLGSPDPLRVHVKDLVFIFVAAIIQALHWGQGPARIVIIHQLPAIIILTRALPKSFKHWKNNIYRLYYIPWLKLYRPAYQPNLVVLSTGSEILYRPKSTGPRSIQAPWPEGGCH